MSSSTLEIPPLICFTLKKHPEQTSLGLKVRQGEDDMVEVAHVSPGGPASATPLRPGFEILSINDHRIRDVKRCVEMLKYYAKKGADMELVCSAGQRPAGAVYVLVKREGKGKDKRKPPPPPPASDPNGDGSFLGLRLEQKGSHVRVAGFEEAGLLVGTKINKGDVLLSIDGRPIHSVDDCRRALKRVTRILIPILTYNVFRKFRSGIVISSTSNREEDGDVANNGPERTTSQKSSGSNKSRCVGDLYAFGPKIGSGGFSVVKKCKLKETGEMYAMKMVNRKKMDKELERALKQEISILNELSHPHIIRLYDTFTTINTVYLVCEYLEGGELFDRIVEKTTYTEKEARDVCSIIFGAIKHCHSHRIAHRDLKPENLLLRSKDNDLDLKIADFGFASKAPAEDSLKTVCGSPGYVSPEILNKVPYGTKTDCWSIGVIIFILLGGYPPFQSAKQDQQFENIKNGRYKFIDKYWGNVSEEAKSLIGALLVVDPRKRMSAADALEHPWMQVDSKSLRRTSLMTSIDNIKQYQASRRFKHAVQSVIFLNKISQTIPANAAKDIADLVIAESDDLSISDCDGDGEDGMGAVFSRPKRRSIYKQQNAGVN